jgi:hypothetical protein
MGWKRARDGFSPWNGMANPRRERGLLMLSPADGEDEDGVESEEEVAAALTQGPKAELSISYMSSIE